MVLRLLSLRSDVPGDTMPAPGFDRAGGLMRYGIIVCLVMAVAVPCAADLSEELAHWVEGPQRFLLTEAESAAWEQFDDAAAQRFIEVFWARRDPDLQTRTNEFRTEFEARVEAADAQFAEPDLRGALTDRGKTLILLGVPSEYTMVKIGDYLARLYRTGRPPRGSGTDTESHIQMQGVSFNLNKGRADVWIYGREQIPGGIEWPTKDDMLTFAFFDHEGTGQFRMQLGIRKSAQSNVVLTAAPGALVHNPELTGLPVYPLIRGIAAATPEQLGWLDSEEELDGVVASLGPGFAGPGQMIGWMSLRLPVDAPPVDQIVVRLTADGEPVGSLSMAVEAEETPAAAMVELAIPAPAGTSVLDVALAHGGQVLHAERLDLELEESADVMISPVYAGADVQQMMDASAGHPFVFGGYHLDVRADGIYRPGENLAAFCLVTAVADYEGPRDGKVRMRWMVDGQRVPSQAPQPVQFAPAGPGIWVWGTQLPLTSLSADSTYTLKLTVTDSASGVSKETELPINIVSPQPH